MFEPWGLWLLIIAMGKDALGVAGALSFGLARPLNMVTEMPYIGLNLAITNIHVKICHGFTKDFAVLKKTQSKKNSKMSSAVVPVIS